MRYLKAIEFLKKDIKRLRKYPPSNWSSSDLEQNIRTIQTRIDYLEKV